jgi:hypothetical protein
MEKSMGSNFTMHDAEIGIMTNKELVLTIYPNTHACALRDKNMFYRYWIVLDDLNYVYLSKYKKSEEDAWKDAWNYIQHEMLNLLEETR